MMEPSDLQIKGKAIIYLIIIIYLASILFAGTNLAKSNNVIKSKKLVKGRLPRILSDGNELYIIYRPQQIEGPGTKRGVIGKYTDSTCQNIGWLGNNSEKISYYGDSSNLMTYSDETYLLYSEKLVDSPNSDLWHIDSYLIREDKHNKITTTLENANYFEPAFINFNQTNYIFYTKSNPKTGDSHISYSIIKNETSVSKSNLITSRTSGITSLYPKVLDDNLLLFYHGFDKEKGSSIWLTKYNGRNWSEPTLISKTRISPQISLFSNEIYVFWEVESSGNIFVKIYNGEQWSGPNEIYGKKNRGFHVEIINNHLSFHVFNDKNSLSSYDFINGDLIDSESITISGEVYNVDTAVYDDKIWIFYDDGEYIRYITYDGESFDYAEAIGGDDEETNIIVRYWWLIAMAGVIAVLLAGYRYRKKGER